MRNVHRYFRKGDISFLTHVTYLRRPILVENIQLLHWSIEQQRRKSAFEVLAWVVLPDHWHLLIDPRDNDVTDVMKRIKLSFGARYRTGNKLRSGRVWHHRYWDHIIRDEEDLNQHFDYIHFNPVKHGLVSAPIDYPHSSFQQFHNLGLYRADWGVKEVPEFTGEFGE